MVSQKAVYDMQLVIRKSCIVLYIYQIVIQVHLIPFFLLFGGGRFVGFFIFYYLVF